MKYRKRLVICVMLAGLMALINSCKMQANDPQLELIQHKILSDFPSASAIEFYNGKLFILGDDARYMLVTDTNYLRLDSVRYSVDTGYRFDKSVKPDVESATIISHNDEVFLYAMGSFSTEKRKNLFFFPLAHKDSFLSIDYSKFTDKLKALPELNIEGLAFADSRLVMANRANKTHRVNKLLITSGFNEHNKDSTIHIIDLELEAESVIGISGLYYIEKLDILLFTGSEEDTPNATQDGTINDSYLGWILNFSKKMEENSIKPQQLIKLSTIDKKFLKQKIESVCCERIEGNDLILHLVADNDSGESGLFRIKLKL